MVTTLPPLEPDQLAAEAEMMDAAVPPVRQGMHTVTIWRAMDFERQRNTDLSFAESQAANLATMGRACATLDMDAIMARVAERIADHGGLITNLI